MRAVAIHRFRFWVGDRHVDIDVCPVTKWGCTLTTQSLAAHAWMRARIRLGGRPDRVEHRGSLT